MDLQSKLTILSLIKENKSILFGKFSDRLTHIDKINKWKDITKQLNETGIVNKDWKYLRDTMWQNWKRRTMEKRDNRFKTGSGGGKAMKYDAADELIISIISKDSPVLSGIDIPESSGTSVLVPTELITRDSRETENTHDVTLSPIPTPTPIKKKSAPPKYDTSDATSNEILQLKKRKLELEAQKLERENYKLDLELMKLEKELNITKPSKFTLPLYMEDNTIIQISVLDETEVNDNEN